MSLRTRLILAFFLLSVVPLAAVTFYTYTTSVTALREAAEREADLLAGDLGQRMELVTAQLSERVEHLMDIAELQAAAEVAQQEAAARSGASSTAPALVAPAAPVAPPSLPAATSVTTTPATTATSPAALNDYIARSLGEAAMLLNNVELQNLRGGRRGGGPPPPGPPGQPAQAGDPRSRGERGAPPLPPRPVPGVATVEAPAQVPPTGSPTPSVTPPVPGATPTTSSVAPGVTPAITPAVPASAAAGVTPQPTPRPTPRDPREFRGSRGTTIGPAPRTPATPTAPGVSPPPQTPPVTSQVDASGKLTIDMAPIRREVLRQIFPEGRSENLTPEERQRLAAEINQRMLGIAQGIQIGAAELQKRAEEVQKEAEAKARAAESQKAAPRPAASGAASVASTASASNAKVTRRSSLSGNRIDVRVERDGQLVRQMNAELNLPNVLATVFQTTRSNRGEVPFAVAKDGAIFTRTEADKVRVESFGAVARPGGPAAARLNDWIIVTTEDKSGSGLRLGIARPVSDSLASLRAAAARNVGLGLLFMVVALVGIVPLSTRLTRDLTTLNAFVGRIARGDYGARVPIQAPDEVGQLADAFNKMAADVERHQRTAVEQERIRRELELGRQIQNEMLPHTPLTLGLTQVQGVSVPAREVGGDFFNYFVLDNGHVALLMGDVSGKGVGAALLMANIQASLRVRLKIGQDLAIITDAIDRDVGANSPGAVYATLFMGILDPATRVLRYVNAGHNPQYVMHLTGALDQMWATGLPVGLMPGHGYVEQRVQLTAGDLLFLYTDGCVEVENDAGEMFGVERLEPLLQSAVASPDALRVIEHGIERFRGSAEALDDATMMTVKVG